jgi:hypothetical protein
MSYNCTRVQGTGTCYGNLNSSGGCEPCDDEQGMMDNHISKTRGVPSQGGIERGPRGQSMTQFRNFSNSEYMNHPGFIGGTWFGDIFTPKKNETKRYDDEYAKQKGGCDYESGDSCVDLQECEDYFQGIYNSNTGNSRVPKRARLAASTHRGKVVNLMNARDCDVTTTVTSSIDQSNTQVDEKNQEIAEIRNDIQSILESTQTEKQDVFNKAQGCGSYTSCSSIKKIINNN